MPSCQYCSSERVVPLRWFNRFMELPNESVGAYKCLTCDLVQRYAFPTASQCLESKEYGEFTAGTSKALQRMVDRLVELEARYGKGPLLDVGAGTGSFIDAATGLGWNALGVEVPGDGGKRNDIVELDITQKAIPSVKPGSVHVIHLHHVLEHVANIRDFLAACVKYLSNSGVLVLEVPNELASLASQVKRLLGVKYNSRTAFLSHKFFFTERVLRQILADSGLRIVVLRTPFVCHGTSWPHRMFDHFQSGIGMGNTIEIHCARLAEGKAAGPGNQS